MNEGDTEYVHVNEHRKCSVENCPNIITHYSYKKGDWDGKVYCREHAYMAWNK